MTSLCRLHRALLAIFVFGLLTTHANSQTTTSADIGAKKPVATDRLDAPKAAGKDDDGCKGKNPCLRKKIDELRTPLIWRIGRGLQSEYKILEQSGTVLITDQTGTTKPFPNPQDDLHQFTLNFKFSELFPDHLITFKRGSDFLKKYPDAAGAAGNKELAEILCDDKPLITCLTNGRTFWKRLLIGVSLNANLSQRSKVQQGLLITPDSFDKKFQFTAGGVFDPVKLFPTVTGWKATFDELKGIDKALALLAAEDVLLRKARPWHKPWAALIPKVEFKILTQFDVIKDNNILIAAPFPERALNTWTFSWDLTRAIPDTKSRIDADALDEALEVLRTGLGIEEKKWQKQCALQFEGNGKDRDIKDLHPAFSAESCQELAEIMNAKTYQLSCVLEGSPRQDSAKTPKKQAPVAPPGNSCNWVIK